MRIDWASRNKLAGAAAFVFITAAAPSPAGAIHSHDVVPSYKAKFTHVTPSSIVVEATTIHQYQYVSGDRLSVRHLKPYVEPTVTPPTDAGGGGGALVMGGHGKAWREIMLKQAREEDEFLIQIITAIVRLL